MKKIIIVLLLFVIQFICLSQPYFQKITTGQVATDVSSSSQCAWGDYNNDGYQDLVAIPWNDGCWPCAYPVLIYKNNGDGTFTRDINLIGQQVIDGSGAAWGDYDNDGRLDLYIVRYFNRTNLLFHNEGNGQFSLVSGAGAIITDANSSIGCSWADYNKDGWLDLFVCNGQNQNDALYKNNGNGTFTKIINDPVVSDNTEGRRSAWGDYDNDGWQDLFVTTYDAQNDMLYHNNGNGTFTRIFTGAQVNEGLYTIGCSWADYDNDGWLDLFVSTNNGNSRLYHNDHGSFSLSGTLPSFEGGWSYVANWADFDNDGWIDLFVPKRNPSVNTLFKNVNGLGFTKVTNDVVGLEGGNSDAGIWADYNNDGKMDLFVANGSGSSLVTNYLYKNITTSGNFITLKLKGCTLNKSAIGTRIKLRDGNTTIIREVGGGNGCQNMLWQHFGLGSVTNIDSITIYWTTGNIQKLTNVNANQILSIDECTIGIINNQIPVRNELKQNYPNPFNPVTQIEYSLLKPSDVKITVYDALGRIIKALVNEYQNYGTYRIDFDGKDLPSGIYIYKLETESFINTRKMMLVK